LPNRLTDDNLNDNAICYVEKEEIKKEATNDQVVKYFMDL
jgi:hypothetical protein